MQPSSVSVVCVCVCVLYDLPHASSAVKINTSSMTVVEDDSIDDSDLVVGCLPSSPHALAPWHTCRTPA